MKLLLLVAFIGILGAYASCENGCSGHGHCGLYDMCKCYGNWEGNDCSGRVCPYEKAWVDSAIADDDAHNYARCANKGECDGKSGQCKCWEPFGGKGCRRMECPNGCSGHGTCEYISELAASNNCDWDASVYKAKTNCAHSSIVTSPVYAAGGVTYGAKHASTMVPSVWDAWKIQGCQCDPGYEGSDCSSRICPSGNDPLRHLDSANAAQASHKYTLTINGGSAQWTSTETNGIGPPTFVLTFTDTFNEKWITRPIPLGVVGSCDSEGTCPILDRSAFATNNLAGGTDTSVALILAHNIRHALLDLPNAAVTGEDVDPRTGEKDSTALDVICTAKATANGLLHCSTTVSTACTDDTPCAALTPAETCGAASSVGDNTDYECTIEMRSAHNSGDLSGKMECWAAGCTHNGASNTANPGGCSPKYQGIGNAGSCTITETVVGTSNYDTCSARGACNGADGLCECYEGFTDEDCSVQTVLV